MAGDPLDLLTPDEFAEYRGGLNTQASSTAGDINSTYNQSKARLAAQRAATAGVGTPPPASSVPVGDNIAPVATAEQAGTKTFGQRLLSGATSRAGGLLKAGLALAPVAGALQAAIAPQSEVKGIADSLGVDYDSGFGRPIANAANFLTKTGDAATFGLASTIGDKIRRITNGDPLFDKYVPPAQESTGQVAPVQAPLSELQVVPEAAYTPPASSGVTRLTGPAAASASRFIDSGNVPAAGTGLIRNNTTGAVTALTTPAPTPTVTSQPKGAFGFYNNFANNYAKASADVSERNRNEKLLQRTAAINLENAKARAAFKPNIQLGLDGRPVVTDVSNPNVPKSVIVTPTQRPSLQQYKDAVRKDPRAANKTETQLENDYNHLVSNGQF